MRRGTDDDARARRRALRRAYVQAERERAMAALTLDRPSLDALLAHVDRQVRAHGCDRSLRYALAWAEQERRDGEQLADALREAGGACDCEVLANVDPEG